MRYSSLYEFSSYGMTLFERVFSGTLDESAVDLSDPDIVSEVSRTEAFVVHEFGTAKELAEAVLKAIASVNLYELMSRDGLWAWLTFILRDQLFSRGADGRWKVGEIHRWYPSDPNDWQKGQRHLVRMPVLLLHTLGANADHLLCGKPSVLPEIREQLTSQQDMFSPTFQSVARTLYFDETRNTLRRGAGGKGGGSPRRLAKVRQQLDVTWDLEDLDHGRIISKLPHEFDKFKLETLS